MTWWYIYAVMLEGSIAYVGMTTNLRRRQHRHECHMFFDKDIHLEVLQRCRTKETAVRAERRMIKRHKPPYNRNYQALGPGKYTRVSTVRPSIYGGHMVPVTVRLRPGMMGIDEAKKIWLNKRFTAGQALARMPGWRYEHALSILGQRLLWTKYR